MLIRRGNCVDASDTGSTVPSASTAMSGSFLVALVSSFTLANGPIVLEAAGGAVMTRLTASAPEGTTLTRILVPSGPGLRALMSTLGALPAPCSASPAGGSLTGIVMALLRGPDGLTY